MNTRPVEKPDEAQDDPCAFCLETPTGRTGHEGLALDVQGAAPSIRLYECFTCFFCGSRWARQRLSAREFQWRRFLD